MSTTTRVYLTNGEAAFAPTNRGSWSNTTGTKKAASRTKAGAAATAVLACGSTDGSTINLVTFVSEPLGGACTFTPADTLQLVAGIKEGNAGLNGYWFLHAWVSQGQTDNVRGTLLSNRASSTTEFTTTATGRYLESATPVALGTVVALAGDCIIIELGYACSSTSASYTGIMNYGNTGSTDLTDGNTSVTTQPGWFELVTAGNPYPTGPLTKDLADSASVSDAMVKSVGKPLADGGSVADARACAVGLARAESASVADAISNLTDVVGGQPMELETDMPTGAATGVGEVSSAGEPMDMELTMPEGTPVPGTTRICGTPMELEAAMVEPESVGIVPDSFDPDTATVLAVTADAAPTPITVRPRDAQLGDANWYTNRASIITGPGEQDCVVQVSDFAEDALLGSGDISGVVIHCVCRAEAGDMPLGVISAPEFVLIGRSVPMPTPPNGVAGEVDYADCASALITSPDGTNPWTWENLHDGLMMLMAKVHVDYEGFTYAGLRVAEVWVEVFGPIGTYVQPVEVSKSVARNVELALTCDSQA